MSRFTCYLSPVTCHMSPVTWLLHYMQLQLRWKSQDVRWWSKIDFYSSLPNKINKICKNGCSKQMLNKWYLYIYIYIFMWKTLLGKTKVKCGNCSFCCKQLLSLIYPTNFYHVKDLWPGRVTIKGSSHSVSSHSLELL